MSVGKRIGRILMTDVKDFLPTGKVPKTPRVRSSSGSYVMPGKNPTVPPKSKTRQTFSVEDLKKIVNDPNRSASTRAKAKASLKKRGLL